MCFHRVLLFSSPGAWVDSIGRRAHTRQYTGDRSLQTTRTAPYVCICSDTRNKRKPAPSLLGARTHFLRRFLFWPTPHSSVADSHRIQNQVVSVSLLISAHPISVSYISSRERMRLSLSFPPQKQNVNTAVSDTYTSHAKPHWIFAKWKCIQQ